MILVVTSKDDLTSDYLIQRIVERGLSVFRFNTEDLLTAFDIRISMTLGGADFTLWDKTRNARLCSSDITGAYFRKPKHPTADWELPEDERAFCERELSETLRSLWRLVPRERWLNSPENLFLASNKVKQLEIARQVGFRIPSTLISSRSSDLLEFANRNRDDLIAKSVKNGVLVDGSNVNFILTTIVASTDYAAIAACETMVPTTIQPRLHKKCDLRITVVGNSVFSVAIHSQEHASTAVDWRSWGTVTEVDLVQTAFPLPKVVADNCIEINRRFGLNFSCIDMVLTSEGDFYFLEINANGQWAWIEEITHLPIRDAIIDCLLE